MSWKHINLTPYGTPIYPRTDPDEAPAKKVPVHEQIVTDENGKRRFHGAFTGGFSAGYWNTVGSQEGWTPQSFKSSRTERAQMEQKKPEDFMDDEDKGEYGIGKTTYELADEFKSSAAEKEKERKRKFAQTSDSGPIPGEAVLKALLRPPEVESGAVSILKKMGWRPGQGAGPRITRKEKKKQRKTNKRMLYVMQNYGGAEDTGAKIPSEEDSSTTDPSDDDGEQPYDKVLYAPDDVDLPEPVPKDDNYGLGYEPLSRRPVLSRAKKNEGGAATLEPLQLLDKSNKKFSIAGQAFGVGALEEEDDDIYERDDLSQYDFFLDNKRKEKKKQEEDTEQDPMVLEGFMAATHLDSSDSDELPFEIPEGWKPRNWHERKTRFEPMDPQKARELRQSFKHMESKQPTAKEVLGDQLDDGPSTSAQARAAAKPAPAVAPVEIKQRTPQELREEYKTREAKGKDLLELISAKSDNFTRGGIISLEDEKEKPMDVVETKEEEDGPRSGEFKPFVYNEGKQRRYDQFIAQNLQDEQEISAFLRTIQPERFSDWDREMEKKEFIQARKIYKPLGGSMSDRFVSEATLAASKEVEKPREPASEKKIVVARTKVLWKPAALLCKRYNIAEPYGGTMAEKKKPNRKQGKLSIFNYLEESVNTKEDFKTPVSVFPRSLEENPPKEEVTEAAPKAKVLEFEAVASSAVGETLTEDLLGTLDEELLDLHIDLKPMVPEPIKDIKPRNDLERLTIEMSDKPISEKLDLYRSIFVDSDSDNEKKEEAEGKPTDKEADDSESEEEFQVPVIPASDPMQVDIYAPGTSASTANILRNTSPPRGIFAALFTDKQKAPKVDQAEQKKALPKPEVHSASTEDTTAAKQPRITFMPRSERLPKGPVPGDKEEAMDTYGPRLPEHRGTPAAPSAPAVDPLDEKLLKLLGKQKRSKERLVVEEEWVEKSQMEDSDTGESSLDTDSSSDSSAEVRKKKKARKTKKKKVHKEHDKKRKKKDRKKDKKPVSHKSKKKKAK